MQCFVKDAVATVEDAMGNLVQTLGRLDYEMDVLVNYKETQANRPKLARIAEYRGACRDFMHEIQQFITKTDQFKEATNV